MRPSAGYLENAQANLRIIQSNLAPTYKSPKIVKALEDILGQPDGEYGLFPSGLFKLINSSKAVNPKSLGMLLSKLMELRQSNSDLGAKEIEILDDAIIQLLHAFATCLNPVTIQMFSDEVKLFLDWMCEFDSIDLVEFIGKENFSALVSHSFDFAFKLIESQWQILPADIIISILKYYACKENVEFINQTVSGIEAVNACLSYFSSHNLELLDKIKNSSQATDLIQQIPYSCNLWKLVDLRILCLGVKQDYNYFGIVQILQRIEEEHPILHTLPLTRYDLCAWAKLDIHFAKMILQRNDAFLSTQQILDVILHFGRQKQVSFENQNISGVVAAEYIVWDFLNEQNRASLIQSPLAMQALKPFRSLYKSLCLQNLGAFALRLAVTPSDDYKNEVRRLLIGIEKSEQSINLVEFVGARVIKAWAKIEVEFASSILNSQKRYLSAADKMEIRSQLSITVSKEVYASNHPKPDVQKLKVISHKDNRQSNTAHQLPKVHPPVLLVINGENKRLRDPQKTLNYCEIKGKNIFHDENRPPIANIPS